MIKFMLLFAAASFGLAAGIGPDASLSAVEARLDRDGKSSLYSVGSFTPVAAGDGTLLARAFELHPSGYVIVTADDALPPVIAYSYEGSLTGPEGGFGVVDLARMDLEQRLELLESTPVQTIERNRELWAACTGGAPAALEPLAQWPPEGTTPTGGWLWENWTQGSPYNAYCPMDNIAGARSVAGCPAVAMGMIVDNLETAMSLFFTDADDYYHNYHEYYWIDDDHIAHDFPSWPELNLLVDTLEAHYANGTPLSNSDKAALVAACGFACKQVFTASVSGTFGVGQAYDAYVRFGFWDCELLYESSDSLYEKLSANMMSANCAHLAIVDEGPNYGHNVVLDGYNTDDYYHINFGWGGSYNGWYQFPLTGMPYGMNIIEGVVLNIGVGMTGVEEGPAGADPSVSVEAVVNPSSGSLPLEIRLPEPCEARVEVYDLAGRLAAVPAEGAFTAGVHEVVWHPGTLPSGVYLVRVTGTAGSATTAVTLLR